MSQMEYSGRPSKPHRVYVVFGVEATRAYIEGERDLAVLNQRGRFATFTFDTVGELNAFIKGVEEATGYLDTLMLEEPLT